MIDVLSRLKEILAIAYTSFEPTVAQSCVVCGQTSLRWLHLEYAGRHVQMCPTCGEGCLDDLVRHHTRDWRYARLDDHGEWRDQPVMSAPTGAAWSSDLDDGWQYAYGHIWRRRPPNGIAVHFESPYAHQYRLHLQKEWQPCGEPPHGLAWSVADENGWQESGVVQTVETWKERSRAATPEWRVYRRRLKAAARAGLPSQESSEEVVATA
jgi:hypothetical protein